MTKVATLMLPGSLGALSHAVHAGGRLLATGGIMQIEGSGGGGLTPWALIAGLGTDQELGASGFCTRVRPQDFTLESCGVALGIRNRVEVSLDCQHFDLGTTVPGHTISQTIVGAKVRVFGDRVIDQDRWWPQVALGMQSKHNSDFDLGLLGFGGDRGGYHLMPEDSMGVFLTDELVLGGEYRQKPNNLSAFREQVFQDAYLVYFPVNYLSRTERTLYFPAGELVN